MAPFDYYSAARQVAEYEKRRPNKYRNSGWRYYDSFYRGAKYGKSIPETGWVFYDTQAWGALKKCWLGYNIAKSQNDIKSLRWYAEGIRKFQKELRLPVSSFPNLGLYGRDEDGSDLTLKKTMKVLRSEGGEKGSMLIIMLEMIGW